MKKKIRIVEKRYVKISIKNLKRNPIKSKLAIKKSKKAQRKTIKRKTRTKSSRSFRFKLKIFQTNVRRKDKKKNS